MILRRIDPIDGLVYILAQLSGGVLGALLAKGLLEDEGRASNYGTPAISDLLGGNLQGAIVEGLGAFILVLCVLLGRAQPERPPAPGSALDRRRPGLPRDVPRPADGRLVQPGSLVRPRAGRLRADRRVGLHHRPAGRIDARGVHLQVRDRARERARRRNSRTRSPRAAPLRPQARLRRSARSTAAAPARTSRTSPATCSAPTSPATSREATSRARRAPRHPAGRRGRRDPGRLARRSRKALRKRPPPGGRFAFRAQLGAACSPRRFVGRRRVAQNEASTSKAAKRNAVFSAFSCASS